MIVKSKSLFYLVALMLLTGITSISKNRLKSLSKQGDEIYPDKFYRIKNERLNECVTLRRNIFITTCHNYHDQKWIISRNQDNSWTITNKHKDRTQVWEVMRGDRSDGANIGVSLKDGSKIQKWDIL